MGRAWTAAGLCLTLACRAPAAATRFVNFDPASGSEAMLTGWSSFERSPEGDTFAWTIAREARLVLRDAADGDRLVRFRCWPYWYEGAPVQTVALTLNGAAVETVRLASDRRVYTAYVPRELWRRGGNDLALAFAYAERPSAHGGGDDRTLAVAFDWLEVVAPPRAR
jgi:hypothetical protein